MSGRRQKYKEYEKKGVVRVAHPKFEELRGFGKDKNEKKAEDKLRENLHHVLSEYLKECSNLSLMLNKLLPVFKIDGGRFELDEKDKNMIFNGILESYAHSYESQKKILEIIRKRTMDFVSSFPYALKLKIKTKDRMVVGLGGSNILERSMVLHRLGFPYIPSSTLKGIFRSAYLHGISESENILKNKSEKESKAEKLFGTQEAEGKLIFTDAYPVQYKLELDVMNPHYPDYYGGNKEKPEDNENPAPLNFITVLGEFEGYVILNKEENKQIISEISDYISNYMGIGAKTRAGYGWVEIEVIDIGVRE
jgi:CRISPR-associated protein Cmr6